MPVPHPQDYHLTDINSFRALWSTFYTRGVADADLVRFLAYFGREGEVVAWCEEIRDRDQDRGKEIRDRDQDRGKERMLLLPNNPSEYF